MRVRRGRRNGLVEYVGVVQFSPYHHYQMNHHELTSLTPTTLRHYHIMPTATASFAK